MLESWLFQVLYVKIQLFRGRFYSVARTIVLRVVNAELSRIPVLTYVQLATIQVTFLSHSYCRRKAMHRRGIAKVFL